MSATDQLVAWCIANPWDAIAVAACLVFAIRFAWTA